MKKKILTKLLSAILFFTATTAFAGPALRIKRTITLADGTKKEVVLWGDENVHFYLDANDNAYVSGENGKFVRGDKAKLTKLWDERLQARNARRLQRARERGMKVNPTVGGVQANRNGSMHKAMWGAESNPVSGQKKGLVILVNFADKSFNLTHQNAFYDGYFNKVGFSEQGMKGSVHDYFLESSYGQFDLTFDVIGPVTVSKNMSYYGQNQYGADAYPAEMVTEACRLADAKGVDFSKYDWDNDGEVDQVFILYAGYGENMGGAENTIWPHESSLEDSYPYGDGEGAIKLDGVKVDTYAVSCELLGSSGTTPAPIGTACHEFSHCMCIPDMYDINYTYFGMSSWDLMDYGAYNGEMFGESPAPFTSYERMYCGWLTPKVLSEPCMVSGMKSIVDEPEAYIIYNEANKNEYYMLENRQQKGFAQSDPAHGLLILHVDFDSQAWYDNTVNSTARQRMTIIPADNVLSENSVSGDTWPGKTKNTALTDTSKPAATLYNENSDGRKYMGKSIENISEIGGLIDFVFAGGKVIPAPIVREATDITADGFTANWTPATKADGYEVLLTSSDIVENKYDIKDLALMIEDFHGFNNGTESNGTRDISLELDSYTTMPGWEGQCVYTTPRNEIRLGNPKSGGMIISPWLPTETKVITVTFTIRSYSTDTEPVYLVMGEGEEGGPVAYMPVSKEPVQYVITASTDTNDWWFGLSCDARCYVSEMSAYEGHITEEQIEEGFISAQREESKLFQTKDNFYKFTGLDSNKKYTYKVRTTEGNARSTWSDNVEVLLNSDADAIETIADHKSVGQIYDMQGRPVNGPISRGIYLTKGKKFWNK